MPQCGHPKKAGHPGLCYDHWLVKQPIEVQVEDSKRAKVLMQERANRLMPDGTVAEIKRPPRETWPVGRQWCHSCYRFRRSWFFGKNATQCRPCVSAKTHRAAVKRQYGEQADYDSLFLRQGGKCAICRNRQVMQRLAVHHDHVTGEVIGLACVRCNHDLLGAAHDSAQILLRAYALQVGGWEAVEKVLQMQEAGTVWVPSNDEPAPF